MGRLLGRLRGLCLVLRWVTLRLSLLGECNGIWLCRDVYCDVLDWEDENDVGLEALVGMVTRWRVREYNVRHRVL